TFNVVAGAALRLVFTTQPVGGVAEGVDFATQPVVSVEDANGNVVTGDSGNVTLAINSGPGAGVLTCSNAGFPTVGASSGVVALSHCQITGTAAAGTYTLKATRSGLTQDVSSNVVINVGSASKLVFTTQPGSATVGSTFGQQPVVKTQDSFGNNSTVGLGASRTVTMSIASGTGTLQGTASLDIGTAAGDGAVTFGDLRIDSAGAKTLQAAAAAGSPVLASAMSDSFTVARGNQTISFGALADKRFDQGPVPVSATASSGLAVTFSSTTPSVCTSGGAN